MRVPLFCRNGAACRRDTVSSVRWLQPLSHAQTVCMPAEALTEQDVDLLLNQVIQHSSREKAESHDWLRPRGVLTFDGPGDEDEDALVRTTSGAIVRLRPAGRRAAYILARQLRAHLGLDNATTESDLFSEVLRVTCSVIDGTRSPKTKNLGRHLLEQTAGRLARSLVVLPIAGLDLGHLEDGSSPPLSLSGRVLLGSLDATTEEAISDMAVREVGSAFRFTDDAWWTEDYNARRRYPEGFEDEPSDESVTVLAIVVDAVDMTATLRARHLAEGVLGALWLADQRDEPWPCVPPTLLGAPTVAENPRSPGLDPDGALPIQALQADTREQGTKAVELPAVASVVDTRTAVASEPMLFDLVAQAETPGSRQRLARRLVAACRLAAVAGQSGAFDLQVLHLVVALESLISDHEAAGGVTDRFVRRLLGLLGPAAPTQGELEALYDARSQVGHQGFSASPLADLADAASFALDLVRQSVFAMASTAATQQLHDDQRLLRWLDLAAPPSVGKPKARPGGRPPRS